MKNELTPFKFETHSVRSVIIDGVPWFVANDVCAALGIANTRDAVSRLDDYEKRMSEIPTPSNVQRGWFVNEGGVYSLVLTSNKPKAKEFKRWLTTEVIPKIIRTGSYMNDSTLDEYALMGRIYSLFKEMSDRSIKDINRLVLYLSMKPRLMNADIARLMNVSAATITYWRKRLTDQLVESAAKYLTRTNNGDVVFSGMVTDAKTGDGGAA